MATNTIQAPAQDDRIRLEGNAPGLELGVWSFPLSRERFADGDGEAAEGMGTEARVDARQEALTTVSHPAAIKTSGLSLWYGAHQALNSVTLTIPERRITAIIGPSGCGKSTLLRCFNRMNDLFPPIRYQGSVDIDGENVIGNGVDLVSLRRKVGMVFQRANPFPTSIFQNVAYGPRLLGVRAKARLEEVVESALKRAALWNEAKDRLNRSGLGLSGGQQQRLCIARALAVEPEVLLLDEPASALDPTATAKIEELILELKETVTVAIVTHNMQQAARISDLTAFMLNGEMVESGPTRLLFTQPAKRLTEDYITGRFG